ncbi:MAG: response regulator, partial [Krumholzibacteria bacterium]|nr:response regulator [Candidatus Krumholzibacteria bacterium]
GCAAGAAIAAPRILFVDDEEPIVSVARTMLERCGYTVEGCVGGASALEILAGGADRFGLLITDAAMPGVDGGTVIRRWRELRPGAPAIVVTGHDEASVPAELRQGGYLAVIRKPFGAETLKAVVREALAATVPGQA